jgi:hypothetical protein
MELRPGATWSAVCGVRAVRRSCSWIVGRLQKSTSGVRPSLREVNNLRNDGLAVPGESRGAVKTRREPGTRRQSRGTGGGLLLEKGAARAALGSTCRWKALWIEQAVVIAVAVVEAVLGSSNEAGQRGRWSAGRDRERQESFTRLVRGRQRRGEVAIPKGIALWVIRARSAGAGEGSKGPKLGRAVKHASLGAGSPQGGPASR